MNKPEGNVFAPETLIDPFDYYRAIHDAGIAIEHLEGMNTYVVYSYDLCSEATTKPEIFSNDFTALMGREADEDIQAILAERLARSADAADRRRSRSHPQPQAGQPRLLCPARECD